MFYFDYLLYMLPALLLGLFAQIRVKSAFSKYSRIASKKGITGEQAAKCVLEGSGVSCVSIRRVNGNLTDNFDPRSNTISLSESVYGSTSVAAVGVAAHEAGHAAQFAEEYFPMKLRSAIIPVCSFGSRFGLILIIASFLLSYTAFAAGTDYLYYAGLALFSLSAVFQLVTLPVEFNASRRALAALRDTGALEEEELSGAKSVLTAAALTYVAALVTSVMQIFYYASRFRRNK